MVMVMVMMVPVIPTVRWDCLRVADPVYKQISVWVKCRDSSATAFSLGRFHLRTWNAIVQHDVRTRLAQDVQHACAKSQRYGFWDVLGIAIDGYLAKDQVNDGVFQFEDFISGRRMGTHRSKKGAGSDGPLSVQLLEGDGQMTRISFHPATG